MSTTTTTSEWTPPEGFTGYRFDLEDNQRPATVAGSSPYQLLMKGEWQTTDLFKWWNVRNQGPVGSCRGHSGAAQGKYCFRLATGKNPDFDKDGVENEKMVDDFSAMWFYLRTQQYDGLYGRDNGATIGGGVKTWMNDGDCPELDFPYPGRYLTAIPSGAAEAAKPYKMARYTRFEGAKDAERLFDWIGSGQGSVDWGTVWPLPFTKGCLVKGLSPRASGGGHATAPLGVCRGADLIAWLPEMKSEVKDDEWILVVANSHSVQAQYRGFYFVTMPAVEAILDHRYTECVGFSDMITPQPRKVDWLKESVLG
jgi:hypothetical protein